MGDSVGDFATFSHVGQSEMKTTLINLEELVRKILGDFQAETIERNIVWKIHPMPVVRADRPLLRLVLVNLISNAVKLTCAQAQAKIEIGCAPKLRRRNSDLYSRQQRGL
jgi:light-regulated signal transduction histidine kinase (bacteriophytochrome)